MSTAQDYEKIFRLVDLIYRNDLKELKNEFRNNQKDLIAYQCIYGTLAHFTVLLRNFKMFKVLVKINANKTDIERWLNITDVNGDTAMTLAYKYNFEEFNKYFSELMEGSYQPSITGKTHNSESSTVENVIKEGYLLKYANIASGYKKRYFILKNRTLQYYTNNGDSDVLQDEHLLKNIVLETDESNPLKFKIFDVSTERTYKLKSCSIAESKEWQDAINNALKKFSNLQDGSFYLNCFIMRITSDFLIKNYHAGFVKQISLFDSINLYLDGEKIDQCIKNEKDELTDSLINLKMADGEEYYDAIENESASETQTSDANAESMSAFVINRNVLPSKTNSIEKSKLSLFLSEQKSITKLPVYYNEPLSLLQRLAEELLYFDLLIKANAEKDSQWRMQYIAAFAISAYFSSKARGYFQFTPAIGEIFYYKLGSLTITCKQVDSETSLVLAENESFYYKQEYKTDIKIGSKDVEIEPKGFCNVYLKSPEEEYKWNKPTTNIKFNQQGKLNISHSGTMTIQVNNFVCELEFNTGGWFDNSSSKVRGNIITKDRIYYKIQGDWDNSVNSFNVQTGRTINICKARYHNIPEYYNMTLFSLQLNYVKDEILNESDSRFRKDIREYENGNIELAQELNNEIMANSKFIRDKV
ncbi:Oxysterol-binding protein-related protein 3 [Astathelohania contejeani]|uniref:Oxysterol-binding protein-related protein 3 n=1 Tax=Astathelohania contejeani TaxID=164912 RepID=A0ABQ7HXN7_9MICR|nr:Oxysterol-binding protein-related protein 3 [Thelohania contejeani]